MHIFKFQEVLYLVGEHVLQKIIAYPSMGILSKFSVALITDTIHSPTPYYKTVIYSILL